MVRNILFDLDGTLIDSSGDIIESLVQSYKCSGYLNVPSVPITLLGPPVSEMVKILTPQFDGQFCDQVTAKFREIYDSSSYPKSFLYEGVHQLLDRFSKKEYSFFVVTNKMKLATTRILSIFDIIQFFRDVITPDYSPLNKMNKTEMIRYVLSTYSLNKAATIMIGDSASDIVAARENDIMSIGFSGGFGNKSELSDSDPTFFASTYNDIEKIISK